jgi:hypothetical protein
MAVLLAIICGVATPHAQINEEGHCETPVGYKVPLVVWVALMLCAMGAVTAVLREKREAFSEYRDSVILGFVGFAVITGLHFSGAWPVGSLILYSVLYLALFLRFYAQRVIWSACGDARRLKTIISTDGAHALEGGSALYYHHRTNYGRVIAFCVWLGSLPTQTREFEGRTFDSNYVARCLDLLARHLDPTDRTIYATNQVRAFVGPSATMGIPVHDRPEYAKPVKDDVLENLYEELLFIASTIWGPEYEKMFGTGISSTGYQRLSTPTDLFDCGDTGASLPGDDLEMRAQQIDAGAWLPGDDLEMRARQIDAGASLPGDDLEMRARQVPGATSTDGSELTASDSEEPDAPAPPVHIYRDVSRIAAAAAEDSEDASSSSFEDVPIVYADVSTILGPIKR